MPVEEQDFAWASLVTPLSVEALMLFCQDIERLYRINPMLEFNEWRATNAHHFIASGKNISHLTPLNFEYELDVSELADGFQINYSNGLKTKTVLKIEALPQGSKLTITDHYDGHSEEERKARLDEVDKSLVTWANYLQRFITNWHKWSRIAAWRWYMRRVWQPMKPSGRRITYMLLWISMVEVSLISLGAAIYFVEYVN